MRIFMVLCAAMRRARAVGSFVVVGAALFSAAGCDGEGDEGATSSSSSGGAGGAGGLGGGGGAGGMGGAGGGSGVACLDPAVHEAFFSIGPPDLCAVAVFDAAVDLSGSAVPTWGRHGGPMTVSLGAAGALEVARWELPADATMGSLTKKTTSIPAGIPQGAFPGAQAIDLPFFDWTAVSWSGAFPSTEGELILAKDAVIEKRYDVLSLFAAVGVSDGAGQGRLLYTGRSALDNPMFEYGALYAADACGAPGNNPKLLPEGDPSCGAHLSVASWGEFSGPIAADRYGNVFALMSNFATSDQEARAFAASTIAAGAPATPGDSFFKMPGFGMSLAVLSPKEAGGTGLLAFQPSDGMVGPLNVVEQRYRVEGATVKVEGGLGPLLSSAKPATSLALLADDKDRLWVGVPVNGATTFVVLARK